VLSRAWCLHIALLSLLLCAATGLTPSGSRLPATAPTAPPVRDDWPLTALLLPVQQCYQGATTTKAQISASEAMRKDAQVPSVAPSMAPSVASSVVGAVMGAVMGALGWVP
jgi:hypothetical protein